jgi:hypothetical protein
MYFHGVAPERLYGIMAEGGMRPSKVNITKKMVGVYACDASENWQTPLTYAIAIPLGNEGLFYQFVLELRAPLDKVKHNSKMYSDHVLDSTATRLVALRVFVTEFTEWRAGDGFFVRPHWDVHLEYHPGEVQGEEPPIDPKSPSLADKLNEVQLMLRSMEVPTSTKNSELDSSQLALQWEFETLRDVQGILPLSHGLMAEIEDHVNKDATTSWTHCHNAPAFLFVIKQSPPDKNEVNEEWTLTVKHKLHCGARLSPYGREPTWIRRGQATTLAKSFAHFQQFGRKSRSE